MAAAVASVGAEYRSMVAPLAAEEAVAGVAVLDLTGACLYGTGELAGHTAFPQVIAACESSASLQVRPASPSSSSAAGDAVAITHAPAFAGSGRLIAPVASPTTTSAAKLTWAEGHGDDSDGGLSGSAGTVVVCGRKFLVTSGAEADLQCTAIGSPAAGLAASRVAFGAIVCVYGAPRIAAPRVADAMRAVCRTLRS